MKRFLTRIASAALVALAACSDANPLASNAPDAPGAAADTRAAPGARFSHSTYSTCIMEPIPAGYVILGYYFAGLCGYVSQSYDSKIVGLPDSPETVCATSTLPAGFEISSYLHRDNCLGSGNNAWVITRPPVTTTICGNQTVPAGYVILSYGSSMSCPNYSATGFNTKTIAVPASPQVACSTSTVPEGWVIKSYDASMSCPNWSAVGFNTFTLKIPGATETVCNTSPVPASYVVVSYGSSMSCPNWSAVGFNTKTIQYLANYGGGGDPWNILPPP